MEENKHREAGRLAEDKVDFDSGEGGTENCKNEIEAAPEDNSETFAQSGNGEAEENINTSAKGTGGASVKSTKNREKLLIVLVLAALFLVMPVSLVLLSMWNEKVTYNGMISYYGNDENYFKAEGRVALVEYSEESDIANIYIVAKVTDEELAEIIESDNYGRNDIYRLVCSSEIGYLPKVGDTVTYMSADWYFYEGYIFPLVYLESDGTVYLTFEAGKANYLDWLNEKYGK